jgi:hypothetical protein
VAHIHGDQFQTAIFKTANDLSDQTRVVHRLA